MDTKNTIVKFDKINNMLDNDADFVKKFCEAGIISFGKFKNEFTENMNHNNLEELKKSGHRIKPAAEMIGVDQLVELYRKGKELLKKDAPKQQIQASILKVEALCNQIVADFERRINSSS